MAYLFFKHDGKIGLPKIKKDFANTLGEKLADEISTQIESAYNNLANQKSADNAQLKSTALEKGNGVATEENLQNQFGVQTKRAKSASKTFGVLYEKLKTDTHPNLKLWLDWNLDIAQKSNGQAARRELNKVLNQTLTDKALDDWEANLDKDYEFQMNVQRLRRSQQQLKQAETAESDEQDEIQIESEIAEQGEIVYPDGALTYGDKSAVEAFKRGYSDKKFDANNQKKVTVDGREMTRLEVVEGIAKGELDESAMKLHNREREYLDWLQKNLLAPLKKIQQAGIQSERANKVYQLIVDNAEIHFDEADDATTVEQLTNLAATFGGRAEKNKSGNTLFKFATPKDAWAFQRVAEFFMNNRHLPYFGQERVTENPLTKLKNISLPEGVKITKVDMAPNSKGVWRVKFVGKFPANQDPAGYNRKQAETNRLFADLARHFNGGLYADNTYHFKNKDDATAFKKALDEHLGLKVTAGTFADNPDLIFNSDAITRTANEAAKTGKQVNGLNDIVQLTRDTAANQQVSPELAEMIKQVQSLGKEITAKLKDGTLTRTEAEEVAGDLTDEFDNIRKQLDAGKMSRTEAQDKMRTFVEQIENRFAKADEKIYNSGEFTNPETQRKQPGIRFTKILPRKEYERLEEIAEEYNGVYYEHGNMILFLDESSRDDFVDDMNGVYRGSEITKPLSQARYVTQLKKILRTVYKIDIPNLEGLSMSIHAHKEIIGRFIDAFANAGVMKFVDGKVEYDSEQDYQAVKNFFANLVQRTPIKNENQAPLPTIDSLKKKLRETLGDWKDGTKIILSPQWDDAEHTATDANEFSIIPTRNLSGDVFKVSYGDFGLAAYDSEGEALGAIRQLNEAIKRGDEKFIFPTEQNQAESSDNERIKQRAQELLKTVGLDNRRPKQEEKLGKIYGQRESDGTFSAYFNQEIDADKLEYLRKMADELGGSYDGKNFKFKDIESLAVFFKATRTAFYGRKDKQNSDNKKALSVENIILPEGYRTETGKSLQESNVRDFIVDENGDKNFGEITPEIERATGGTVKAAPIRLQVGNGEFGYIHLTLKHLSEMQRKGFDDSISYLKNILQNINKIYSRVDTGNIDRFLLVNDGEKGHSSNFMPIDLELEKGEDGYYRIVTAYSKKLKKC